MDANPLRGFTSGGSPKNIRTEESRIEEDQQIHNNKKVKFRDDGRSGGNVEEIMVDAEERSPSYKDVLFKQKGDEEFDETWEDAIPDEGLPEN